MEAIECFSARIVLGSDDAARIARCVERLSESLCSGGWACAGKAYWFLSANDSCAITAGGEARAAEPPIYGRAYEYSLSVVCRGPRQLVEAVAELLKRLDECEGVRVRLERRP